MPTNKPGRPKTLDREHVLNVALMSYWSDGPAEVSINEICKRAGVSKPGLYREFGNEDGLKRAVITAYASKMLSQFRELLTNDMPFTQTLQALIATITTDPKEEGQPNGCLHVEMCNCSVQLGELTAVKVEEIRQQSLVLIENWIERAKADNELKANIPTPTAALYIHEQINNSMSQQKRGVPAEDIEAILKLALSVFEQSR